jgi:hypothetical protein
MIERRPEHRLTGLAPRGGTVTYAELSADLAHGFTLAAEESAVRHDGSRFRKLSRFAPDFLEPKQQFNQWRKEGVLDTGRTQGGRANHTLGRRDRTYLLVFSLLASVAWLVVLARSGLLNLGDVVEEFPRFPNLPTGEEAIAVAQGLVVLKYYQTMLARLTLRHVEGVIAAMTEVAMRITPFIAIPTVIVARDPDSTAWAWSCAVGAIVVSVSNVGLWWLGSRMLQTSPEQSIMLSTVPRQGPRMPRGFEQWWWTMLLYALVIGVIAVGLQTGELVDRPAYIFGLLLINIGIHYIAKISLTGGAIRGGLVRAFAAGHRRRVIEARTALQSPVSIVSGPSGATASGVG